MFLICLLSLCLHTCVSVFKSKTCQFITMHAMQNKFNSLRGQILGAVQRWKYGRITLQLATHSAVASLPLILARVTSKYHPLTLPRGPRNK